MPKTSSTFICQQCGYRSSQFLGRCPECSTWNSLVETIEGPSEAGKGRVTKLPEVINLDKIQGQNYQRLSTNLGEFDRVLGGGIVLGSLVLVSGEPGVGKSTLLTQLALSSGKSENQKTRESDKKEIRSSDLPIFRSSCLYVAGEESAQQIKLRADRIKPKAGLLVLNETDIDVIIRVIKEMRENIGLVIIDSIQTLQTSDLSSIAGSVGQVRECAHRLQQLAKSTHLPIFLVGHVTKDGTVAGPKTLEHLVDVVLSLEGESSSNFRVLRASKNRFGPTDEVGIFEMEETGMIEVKNPSKLFLDQKVNAPGSAVVATLAGYRPILVEVQALVTKTFLPIPRRTGSGIDNNRLQLLVAVLSKRLNLPLYDQDIFVNITGGLKVVEPAADLAIAMAIISSFKDQSLPNKSVFLGEVGLLGELRNVRSLDKRTSEAKKLGFTNIISSESAKSLAEAVKVALK